MSIVIVACCVIFLSAFCSLAEASLVAVNHIKVKGLMKKNKRIAKIIESKKDYLGSIIVANTVVNISGSVIIGSLMGNTFIDSLSVFNLTISVTTLIVTANIILTYFILVFAEMLPKFYASTHPEKVLKIINWPLFILRFLMIPFLIMTKGVFKKLINDDNGLEVVTKEEVEASINAAIKSGSFKDKRATLLINAISLAEHKVSDLFIDDFDLEHINEDEHINTAIDKMIKFNHRKSLTVDNNGNITGVVLVQDVMKGYIEHKDVTINYFKHDILKICSDNNMIDLLNELDIAEEHLVLIVDKDDKPLNVITTNDILHKLVA